MCLMAALRKRTSYNNEHKDMFPIRYLSKNKLAYPYHLTSLLLPQQAMPIA